MLISAAKHGRDEVVSELLRRGADVNKTNKDGFSALFVAIQSNDLRMMEQLLVAGADTELRVQVCGSVLILFLSK